MVGMICTIEDNRERTFPLLFRKTAKRIGTGVLLCLLAALIALIAACSSQSDELVGTWEHSATVINGDSSESLETHKTFDADGTGRFWYPQSEDEAYFPFRWEVANGELLLEQEMTDLIQEQLQGWRENESIPDSFVQDWLDNMSQLYTYEIDGNRLILHRPHLSHLDAHEIYTRVEQ